MALNVAWRENVAVLCQVGPKGDGRRETTTAATTAARVDVSRT